MQGSVEYGMVFNRHLPGGVVKTGSPKNFRKFPSKTLINHSYFGKFAELKLQLYLLKQYSNGNT